jgi:hypothetical protein
MNKKNELFFYLIAAIYSVVNKHKKLFWPQNCRLCDSIELQIGEVFSTQNKKNKKNYKSIK